MSKPRLIAPAVFILAAVFYMITLLPSVAWGDGIKLQSEAITGESFVLSEMTDEEFSPDAFVFSKVGVAAWDHPLYIMLGYVLVRTFSFVDALWLINFLSAFFGAASIALVYMLSHRYTGSFMASCYAAFSLAVSHTFWWHSSTPEVYTLFAFLLLASLYFFDRFERTRRHPFLFLSGMFLGLAASNHMLAFLALPAVALYYLLFRGFRVPARLEAQNLIYPSLGFLTGFLVYLIQFARMARSFPLAEIMGPVVGMTFLSRLGGLDISLLAKSLVTFLFLLAVQFNPIGVILGAHGIRGIFRSERYSRKILACFIAFSLFGVFYQVSDQFAFFLSAYVFWSLMMGIGVDHFLSGLRKNIRLISYGALGLLILGTPLFYAALPGLAKRAGLDDASAGIPQIGVGLRDGLSYYINPDKRGDFSAYDFGQQTVAGLAPEALVLAEWYTDTDEYFVLRYFVAVEGLRPDVTIVGWPAHDPFSFDSRLALDVIEDALPGRPVYLASLSDHFYASGQLVEKYCILPEDNLYRLYPRGAGGAGMHQSGCIRSISE